MNVAARHSSRFVVLVAPILAAIVLAGATHAGPVVSIRGGSSTGYFGGGLGDAVPLVESVVLESPEANGLLGARGIGEITMIPVVPAITAAIPAAWRRARSGWAVHTRNADTSFAIWSTVDLVPSA